MQRIDREIVGDYGKQVRRREKIIHGSRFHHANRRIIAEVVKGINDGYGKILEIGCGHGDVTQEYIAPNCAWVVAIDITKRFVGEEICNNVKFLIEDALDLSFRDETFDGVISIDVIEHIRNDTRFIQESLRVLKKGGTLFFTTPNRLRLMSLVRCLIGKPIKFPHSYAHDATLGDILHLREYSFNGLLEFLKSFSVDLAEIKGVWFGIPAFQIGIVYPPKFLERWSFCWHVKMIKK